MRTKKREWMEACKEVNDAIRQEKEDGCSNRDSDVDFDGSFHTSSHVIIYQRVDENPQAAATIPPIASLYRPMWLWPLWPGDQVLKVPHVPDRSCHHNQ